MNIRSSEQLDVSPRQKFETLQVFRGAAAVAVAFYHVYIILMEPQYGGTVVFQPVARYGFLGVSFFFVLSGFIILMAHKRDIGRPLSSGRYVYKRIVRVYPVYWIYTTLFILAAFFGLGYPDFSWDPFNLIASYLLLPVGSDVTLPLKVAWTLVYEIRFYLIFLILITFGWSALWVFWAWGGVILVLFIAGVEATDLFSPWNLYFIAGMVGFMALNRLHGKHGIYLLMLGVGLTILYGFLSQDVERIAHLNRERPELHFLLAPAFLALILGVVTIEKHRNNYLPNWLKFLGDASYSIYLVHSAAISVLVIIFKKTGLMETIGLRPTFLIIFSLSVMVGCLAYVIVERPLIRIFRKWGGRRKAVQSTT